WPTAAALALPPSGGYVSIGVRPWPGCQVSFQLAHRMTKPRTRYSLRHCPLRGHNHGHAISATSTASERYQLTPEAPGDRPCAHTQCGAAWATMSTAAGHRYRIQDT